MTLSIAWVTPFGQNSDVSAFSRNLLLELARWVEAEAGSLTVFVNRNGANYWTHLPLVDLTGTPQDREMLLSFDHVIYNIGNNARNHRHINWLSHEVPGVVIVHDMVMQHFLAEELFERFRRKEFYARLMGEYYGEAGLATVGQSQICSEVAPPIYAPWDTLHVADKPLLEPFIETAAALVVHSGFAESFVAPRFSGPILRLALPWDQKPFLGEEDLVLWRAATAERAACLVVCFGYIGRAKCLDTVIAAFASSDLLRRTARLIIAGYPGDQPYTDQLSALVRAHGLSGVVEFEFAVSDQRLLALKRAADVFVNLRDPNTESASGSMVEQMNAGKPLVVYPSGCYAEIAEDAAVFVAKRDGVAGLVRALETIVADPEARIRIGENGRRHVRRIGRSEYVAGLIGFLRQHTRLLCARKRLALGQRDLCPDADAEFAEDPWLERMIKTRRLLEELKRPRHALSLSPFEQWDPHALVSLVVVGLFGQTLCSALERNLRVLFSRHQRPDFYRIVGNARLVWLACRGPYPEREALARLFAAAPLLCTDVLVLLRSLGDDMLASALYLTLLGRLAAEDEIDAYVKRLAHEPLEKIVREFLHSEEFKRRGAPALEVARALEWCAQDHYSDATRQTLDLGAQIVFSSDVPECRNLLGSGWHALEQGHVWSRSPVCTVIFSLSDEAAAARCRLSVEGRVTGTASGAPRTLRASCNGGEELSLTLANDDWFGFDLELRALPHGGDDFVILFDAGATAAAEHPAQDPRRFGFCLRAIRIAES